MRAAYYTLGCKVNYYDTETVADGLAECGYESVDGDTQEADVIIINTCAVTNESERKSRQLIRKLKEKHPQSVIVVTGCYSQIKPDEVKKKTGADIICGVENRNNIPKLLNEYLADKRKSFSSVENTDTPFAHRTRAYLKIQDGCKMFCSYCVVPYARSTVTCMPQSEIITKCKEYAKAGYKEIVLTGIHIASYKHGEHRLIDAVGSVCENTDIDRIRLGSLEPKLMSEDFVSRLSGLGEKICPHFHISLQSGSESVLKRMNRKYTPEFYLEACDRVRSCFRNAMITTDIIVGFPAESEKQFTETCEFVKKARFSHVHIFPYSPKEGTPAAEFTDQIPNAVKHERAQELMRICSEVSEKEISGQLGTTLKVLCEKHSDGISEGLSENYIRVRYPSPIDDRNKITPVTAKSVEKGGFWGEIYD